MLGCLWEQESTAFWSGAEGKGYVGGKKCVKQKWCKVSADLLGGILQCWGQAEESSVLVTVLINR